MPKTKTAIEFETRAYPGLSLSQSGRNYKFAGGILRVAPEEADDIRTFAARRSLLGIVENGEVQVPDYEAMEQDLTEITPPEPSMNMTKADLLEMAVERGVEADESMTKVAIIAALNGETG